MKKQKINSHLTIKVTITKSDRIPDIDTGYATLYDHNTGRVIRTVRGRFLLIETTEEEFLERMVNELTPVIERYTILASVQRVCGECAQAVIEEWLEDDAYFNDAKWHGDDEE